MRSGQLHHVKRLFRALFLTGLALLLGLACKPLSTSNLSNIYRADNPSSQSGLQRRHAASALEINWTVKLKNCSALMLSPQLVITAYHCAVRVGEKFNSGWSVLNGGSEDLEYVALGEQSETLDYKIMRVRWLVQMPTQIKFPPRIATKAEDVFTSTATQQGDELFTVGFPADRDGAWPATYAEGLAKTIESGNLLYNVGVINGNSGGGVLKKESLMLVSLVNGGGKNIGEDGWENADENAAEEWNFGTGLWQIYRVSAILKQQFPDGANAHYKSEFQPKAKIYLSIREIGSASELLLATSHQAKSLLVCPGLIAECTVSTPGAESIKPSELREGRTFFRPSRSPELLREISLSALDQTGAIIAKRQLRLQRSR